MPLLRMYWDRTDDPANPAPGLEILDTHWQESSAVPPDACGFLLGPPPWPDLWWFAPPGQEGVFFEKFGIVYSSVDTPNNHEALEARGPVNGCSAGDFEFKTPLAAFGIFGDMPVRAGAGSFAAEIREVSVIQWLDAAGNPVDWKPDLPGTTNDLFEPPIVAVCALREDGTLNCQWQVPGATPPGQALPGSAQLSKPGNGDQLIPRISTPQVRRRVPTNVTTRPKPAIVEVRCPVPVTLTASFRKKEGAPPGPIAVHYCWDLPPFGRSSTFSTVVADTKPHTVEHTVSFPFPPAIKPQGDGSRHFQVDPEITNRPRQDDRPRDRVTPGVPDPKITARPESARTIWARVRILNAEDLLASGWASVELVCR